MLPKSISLFVFVFIFHSVALSQEMHEWKSKSGHTTRAALLKVDEQSRKVTLLIPKEMDIDKLDDDSIALARKLSMADRMPSESPASSMPVNQELGEMRFLRQKYEALTAFKASEEFAEWGYSIGGPYGSWLKEVEKAKHSNSFVSTDVKFAVGHLLTLGLEYKDNKGKETEYAKFANECIKGVLNGQSKDEFERRAMAKIESIVTGKSGTAKPSETKQPANQPANAEYKYVQDDFYPDVYAFRSVAQLKHYLQLPSQNPILNANERSQLGIELVESKTKILVTSRIPYSSITIFEFVPTTGRNKGKRLYGTSFDIYDNLR